MLMIIVLFALIGLTAWLFAYTGKVQSATLWAGRRIGEPEFETQNPKGFQDAITPKAQTTTNILVFILYFAILVMGSIIKWNAGTAGVVIAVFASVIMGRFLSNDLDRYLLGLTNNMARREADYRKDNDTMRADAAHDMLERLSLLLTEIHGKGVSVPSIKEARRAPMGLEDYE
jgi:ABC-type multidrug transport system fused ATPase/permease subunit